MEGGGRRRRRSEQIEDESCIISGRTLVAHSLLYCVMKCVSIPPRVRLNLIAERRQAMQFIRCHLLFAEKKN